MYKRGDKINQFSEIFENKLTFIKKKISLIINTLVLMGISENIKFYSCLMWWFFYFFSRGFSRIFLADLHRILFFSRRFHRLHRFF